jgi:aminoglycoside/choline kinase family phosphotransferase
MSMAADLQGRLVAFVRAFAGGEAGEVQTLVGDASARRYYRVRTGGLPSSSVVMELPADAPAPVSPGVGPAGPSFIAMQSYLAAGGFPVPRVFRADLELGLIALEDLGDQTLDAAVRFADPGARRALYARAVTLVAELQRIGASRPDPSCLAFQRSFDERVLRWELEHFREWLLEKGRGQQLGADEASVLDQAFSWLASSLAESPAVLVHRDFQSRNIMVTPAAPGSDGVDLRVIDFQDALLGSRVYDLVALLRDSYVELRQTEVADLLGLFADAAQISSLDRLRKLFHMQTVQRKLKDAGRFVFLDRVRGNAGYLRWIPNSLAYVAQALPEVPELEGAAEVLRRHLPELRLP